MKYFIGDRNTGRSVEMKSKLVQGETYFLKDAIEKKTTNGFFCRFELYNNLGHFIDDSIVGVGFTAEEAVFDARKKAENLKIEIKLLN